MSDTAMAQGGVEVWRRTFPDASPFPGNVQDEAVKSLYVNGTIVVAGTRTIGTTSYFQVVKYNTDGTNGASYSDRWPTTSKTGIQRKVLAAAATVGGNQIPKVFLAGLVPSGPSLSNRTVQIVAFDGDTLDLAWTKQLETGMSTSETVPVAIAADNVRVAVTYATRINDDNSGINITTVVLDQDDGGVVYGPTTFSSPGNQTDLPVGIVFDPHSQLPTNSRVYVAGTWPSPMDGHGLDYTVMGYDFTSTSLLPVWAKSKGDVNHNSTAMAIGANAKNKSVCVTGSSSAFAGITANSDYFTVRLDSETGDEGWRAYYDGPAQSYDVPTAIALQWPGFTGEDVDINYVYVTGHSRNAAGNDDILTLRYWDQVIQYEQDWEGRYDRGVGGFDQGTSVVTHINPPAEV